MKRTLLATTLSPDLHRKFGVKAAERGESKAELLRALVAQFISLNDKTVISQEGPTQ